MSTIDNILDEIEKADSIVILTHEDPDGDAVGTSLALYHALKKYNKKLDLIIPEYPRVFEFLPGTDEIKTSSEVEKYDLAISVDCATEKRLNGFVEYFENAKVKIQIDHHSTNTMFGDINFVNPDSPACSQIMIGIFEEIGIEITKDIGTCILTGIITDTGGFKHQGVNSETFEFVAELLDKGINVSNIYRRVLEIKTRANFELEKIAIDRLELLEDGKIAFTYLLQEDEERVNAQNGDHEGIVEIGRAIEGVEVSVFVRQTEKGLKVSTRSNDYVNVSDICIMFGGGGHPRAAGVLMQGTIDQVKEKLLYKIKEQL